MKKILKEFHSSTYGCFLIPKKRLISKKSKFQKIEVFEHDFYGRILRLDNFFQTSEFDEFLYHESITHFALFAHKNPKKILIIGGGDGGVLKEVIKHKKINEISLVDIDKEVIDISKRFLKKIHNNSFNDKRVEIIIKNGFEYIKEIDNKFDVIILDLTDPEGKSYNLYTKEFYSLIANKLNKGGIFSLHPESPIDHQKVFSRMIATLKSVFNHYSIYPTFIPLYGTLLSFVICSNDLEFSKIKESVMRKRFNNSNIKNLKLFCPEIFISSLNVPKYILEAKKVDKRISTLKNPISNKDFRLSFNSNNSS